MMERHLTRDVRNIALAGHSGSGKTSLIEAILHVAGCSDRMGRVEDGNTTTDYDPEEIKRRISIHLALAPCTWDRRFFNWIDTPGYPDFVGEFLAALQVVDDVLLVTPAQSANGTEFGLETSFDQARVAEKAEAIFINKMDRENADFFGTVAALRERFGNHVVPAVLPIGSGDSFRGVIDLVTMRAYTGTGRQIKEESVPDDLRAEAEKWRQVLVEVAAEGDDELIEEFLEGKELTEQEIERGIHEDLLGGRIVPVFCGSATRCMGIQPLLHHLAMEFESPDEAKAMMGVNPVTGRPQSRCAEATAPFSALVFKTVADPYVGKQSYLRIQSGVLRSDTQVWNANREQVERIGPLYLLRGKNQEPIQEAVAGDIVVVSKLSSTTTGDTLCDKAHPIIYGAIRFPEPLYALAAAAKTKQDEDKLGSALARVAEEDPSFIYRRDLVTGETLLFGQGETHLDIVVARLARLGAQVTTQLPRVPYRETVTRSARAQGRHKKQTGGRGQFGDCWLTVEPHPDGAGFEFIDRIVGGAIPRQYIPAVEKGVREAMARGILSGNPVDGVRVTVDDGSFHSVDSSEAAFVMAGILGFQNAAKAAGPVVLEPILEVWVTVPDAFTGDLMGDFNARRGHVLGIEPAEQAGYQTVRAHVPQAEMLRYAVDLRSLARGRGRFTARHAHYAELPHNKAAALIAEYEKRKASGHD